MASIGTMVQLGFNLFDVWSLQTLSSSAKSVEERNNVISQVSETKEDNAGCQYLLMFLSNKNKTFLAIG